MTNLNDAVLAIIEQAEKQGMTSFGVRAMTSFGGVVQKVTVGDCLDASNDWDDGISSDVKLGGTCALSIKYDGFEVEGVEQTIEKLIKHYASNGEQIVLIGGVFVDYGNDPGEVIIADATVLHVF